MMMPALVGLALGSAWIYYIFRNDADNDAGTLRLGEPLVLVFLLLYGLGYYYAYLIGPKDLLTYSYTGLYLSMLLSIAFVDIKTGYLYDFMLGFYAVLLALLSYVKDAELLRSSLLSMLIVFLFYGLIYVVARLIYGREAFGTGDIFFVTVVVMNMQALHAIVLAFLAFYVAAIYLLMRLFFKGRTALSAEIAFCPYIAAAALIMYLFEHEVDGILNMLSY